MLVVDDALPLMQLVRDAMEGIFQVEIARDT
jgi:hypothetical protein